MANRGDFNSVLPRQIKRMLALQPFKDAHEYGEIKRLWIGAHDHAKRVRNRQLASRDISSPGDSTD